MEREAAELKSKPAYAGDALDNKSDTAAHAGKFAMARDLTRLGEITQQVTVR